ncbi:MAG: hypothetical protein ABI743_03600 [bacterium]
MRLTNTLTEVVWWVEFLAWATIIGAVALRATGYSLNSLAVCTALGTLGLVLGRSLFPHGVWDPYLIPILTTYRLIPAICWAAVLPGGMAAVRWWIDVGEERWNRAAALAKEQAAQRRERHS